MDEKMQRRWNMRLRGEEIPPELAVLNDPDEATRTREAEIRRLAEHLRGPGEGHERIVAVAGHRGHSEGDGTESHGAAKAPAAVDEVDEDDDIPPPF